MTALVDRMQQQRLHPPMCAALGGWSLPLAFTRRDQALAPPQAPSLPQTVCVLRPSWSRFQQPGFWIGMPCLGLAVLAYLASGHDYQQHYIQSVTEAGPCQFRIVKPSMDSKKIFVGLNRTTIDTRTTAAQMRRSGQRRTAAAERRRHCGGVAAAAQWQLTGSRIPARVRIAFTKWI